jgi:hypothetical protein
MTTSKSRHKRIISKRIRRALNSAELPPTQVGNKKLVKMRWGVGPRPNHSVDGMSDPYIYDYADETDVLTFYFGTDCCDCCEQCPHIVYESEGEGWSYDAANIPEEPKLGELFVA